MSPWPHHCWLYAVCKKNHIVKILLSYETRRPGVGVDEGPNLDNYVPLSIIPDAVVLLNKSISVYYLCK